MAVDPPLHLRLGLVSDEPGAGLLPGPLEGQRGVVDSVADAFPPECVPGTSQDEIPSEPKVERRVHVHEVRWANQRDLPEVRALGEECIEGPQGAFARITIAADDIRLE